MSPEFSANWGTEFLNTRFPLPTLLCEADLVGEGLPVRPVHIVNVQHHRRLPGSRGPRLVAPRQQRHARREHRADAARL